MKKILWVAMMVFSPLVESAMPLDFTVQPRFKTGVQFYEYQQKRLQTPARDPLRQFPNIQEELTFSDWLPFVGGGVSLFIDRFFVDFDVQYSFDGQDDANFSNQNFLSGGGPFSSGTVIRSDAIQSAEFDRLEWAVSAGFKVFDNLVLFAGYKKAKTDFTTDLKGHLNGFQASNMAPAPFLTGSYTGKLDLEFEYDGPFVGANYSWRIQQGFLDGVLSFNFAAAFLDGVTNLNFRDVVANTITGATVPLDFQSFSQTQGRGSFSNLKGDTTGFSFGVAWRGLTAVKGLTYSLGVSGYRYEFNSVDNNTPDFNETQVRLDFGIAYAFDF